MSITLPSPRRTQAERRASTRGKLLDAALECLVRNGYQGTTMVEVQQLAGVSRGALQHYWPSKADLVVAAVDHLFDSLIETNRRKARNLVDSDNRIDAAVDILWSSFELPLFLTSLDLWQAARTDPDLRAVLIPHEQRLGEEIRAWCRELFSSEVSNHPRYETALDVVINSMRGTAATGAIKPRRSRPEQLIAEWKRILRSSLEGSAS